MTPIADITQLRTLGGLLTESAGGVTDAQLTPALTEASLHLRLLVSAFVYKIVSNYNDSSSDDQKEKKQVFAEAEACFALSFLPTILSNTQLQQTGYKLEAGIGKSRTVFGNPKDISVIADFWEMEALKRLSPYMDSIIYDEDDNERGWESDDGNYSLYDI